MRCPGMGLEEAQREVFGSNGPFHLRRAEDIVSDVLGLRIAVWVNKQGHWNRGLQCACVTREDSGMG